MKVLAFFYRPYLYLINRIFTQIYHHKFIKIRISSWKTQVSSVETQIFTR